jgi:ankyrin repeat protein
LLEKSANIEARDEKRQTPLLIAAARNHMHALQILVTRGASTTVRDIDNRTVLDIARTSGYEHIEELLVSIS